MEGTFDAFISFRGDDLLGRIIGWDGSSVDGVVGELPARHAVLAGIACGVRGRGGLAVGVGAEGGHGWIWWGQG